MRAALLLLLLHLTSSVCIDEYILHGTLKCAYDLPKWCFVVDAWESDVVTPNDFEGTYQNCSQTKEIEYEIPMKLDGDVGKEYELGIIVRHQCSLDGRWKTHYLLDQIEAKVGIDKPTYLKLDADLPGKDKGEKKNSRDSVYTSGLF